MVSPCWATIFVISIAWVAIPSNQVNGFSPYVEFIGVDGRFMSQSLLIRSMVSPITKLVNYAVAMTIG